MRLQFFMQIQAPRPIQVKTQLYRLYQNVQRKLEIHRPEQVVVAMTKSQKSFYREVAKFVVKKSKSRFFHVIKKLWDLANPL